MLGLCIGNKLRFMLGFVRLCFLSEVNGANLEQKNNVLRPVGVFYGVRYRSKIFKSVLNW